MEATVITTVYNEESSIDRLIEALLDQTKQPSEIVIVDAGSQDRTQDIIQSYDDPYIKLVIEEDCNISEGRNIAIEKSSNNYIVTTDAGCIPEEDWYENIVSEFEDGAKFVAGMWRPDHQNIFEKVQGRIVANTSDPEEFKQGNRGASAKSSGFTKEVWEDVEGYPEDLYTGEDSKFCSKVLREGYNMAVAENAYVNWHMRPDWTSYFKQFYKYGEGDAKGGNLFTHPNQKIGITKNMLLLGLMSFRLVAVLSSGITLLYYPILTPITLTLFLTTILTIWIYDKQPLEQTLIEDGIRAFLTGLILSEMKATAWFIGFTKEHLKNPKLILRQFQELK